jgi:hypothetical protein
MHAADYRLLFAFAPQPLSPNKRRGAAGTLARRPFLSSNSLTVKNHDVGGSSGGVLHTGEQER